MLFKKLAKQCANGTCRKWMNEIYRAPIIATIKLHDTESTFEYCSQKCFNETLARLEKNSKTLIHGVTTVQLKSLKDIGNGVYFIEVEPCINLDLKIK